VPCPIGVAPSDLDGCQWTLSSRSAIPESVPRACLPSWPCGFDSRHPLHCDVSGHPGRPNPIVVGSAVLCLAGGAGWSAGALVALGCVEGEFAEEFAGGGVDDADVEVVDQDEDAGSAVGSPDADGVEPATVTEGDLAGVVDAVAADPVVGIGLLVAGGGLGTGLVGGGGGGSVRE
jgi:hypothetical protein